MTRNEAAKRLRVALKAKTGKSWSVSGGRGTGYGWLTIQAPRDRRVARKANPGYNGFDTVTECVRKTGSLPWLEYISEKAAENQYTSDHDSAILTHVFKTHHGYHHQGLSVSPENWERFVELAEA